jgi:hypothetical protein
MRKGERKTKKKKGKTKIRRGDVSEKRRVGFRKKMRKRKYRDKQF